MAAGDDAPGGAPGPRTPVLEVDRLVKLYPVRRGFLANLLQRGEARYVRAVDGVSFSIRAGEVLGLAGESGCGKSTTGMTVLKLFEPSGGTIRLAGEDVAGIRSRVRLRTFRRSTQIVFQNPFESLNPRFTVLDSVLEPIRIHFPGAREMQLAKARLALERSGLSPTSDYEGRYPHELSGGQLQRVAIARAIGVEPKLLVADEPVSMLDVSIRAGILTLFKRFAADLDMAILYISHDLSTMRHICHSLAVMYLGSIVEHGPADAVLDDPQHPYARALIAAVPQRGRRTRRRIHLQGSVPNAVDVPKGCRFHPRCPQAMPQCSQTPPAATRLGDGRVVACHLHVLHPATGQLT